jgi:hypothetical protein
MHLRGGREDAAYYRGGCVALPPRGAPPSPHTRARARAHPHPLGPSPLPPLSLLPPAHARARAGYGIGSRATAYQDLYKCLKSAKTPQGTPCLYDFTDFERMRYGSCVFYACYPAYIALMNSTGGRFYAPPLLQFSTAAACEAPSIKRFYESLYNTPCITIPNLDSWKCALLNPGSLSVAATQAAVTLIILGWFGGYLYHMRTFGGEGALANWLQAPLKDDPGSAARLE